MIDFDGSVNATNGDGLQFDKRQRHLRLRRPGHAQRRQRRHRHPRRLRRHVHFYRHRHHQSQRNRRRCRQRQTRTCPLTDGSVVGAGGIGALIAPGANFTSHRTTYFNNNGLAIDYQNNGLAPITLDPPTTTAVSGMVTGPPSTDVMVEAFANTVLDPTGFGEGETFLGHSTVSLGPGGTAPFSIPVSVAEGTFITTRTTTSEFSQGQQVPLTGFVEHDLFDLTYAELGLTHPLLGPVLVKLVGPTAVDVLFRENEGDVVSNGSGPDTVQTVMVQMELTGKSPQLGDVTVRLNPMQPTLGQITEQQDLNDGRLDVFPFIGNPGDFLVDSIFNVFVEVEVGGDVFHNQSPVPVESTHGSKAPTLEDPPHTFDGDIPLFDEQGGDSGIRITSVSHKVVPPPGSIHGTKYADFNRNGRRDPNEPGIDGVDIVVTDLLTQQEVARVPTMSDPTLDGNAQELDPLTESGLYWITLPPGFYIVSEDTTNVPDLIPTNPQQPYYVSLMPGQQVGVTPVELPDGGIKCGGVGRVAGGLRSRRRYV